tara:strand:- start:25441 stop:26520 length:1080 start_codon:yes stop_codon:yes gene_type:complete
MYVPVNRVFNNVSRNLGLNEYSNHIDSWAEWAFEAEQYIGSKETFLQEEITYSSDLASPTAKINFASNPADKDWVEINGTRFYFRNQTGLVDSDDYVVIKESAAGTVNVNDTTTGGVNADVIFTDILSTNIAKLAKKINNSYYNNLKGISAAVTATAAASSGEIILTYNREGDEGNSVTLMTSGSGDITQFFSGGKEKMHNKQVRLPDNLVKLLSIRAGDTIVQPTSSQFKSKVSNLLHRYYVDGNRVNFSVDYTADVVISYLAVPMSEEGYPMVKQGHEEAIAFYIMWKHKSVGYYSGKVPQYIVKDLEKRWYQLCGKVRGDDNMPNSTELLKIGKIWNSKIPVTSSNSPLYDGLNSY